MVSLVFIGGKWHPYFMDTVEILKLAVEAEAKSARGEPLSRQERMALLAKILVTQETRREKRYGRN